MRNGPRRWQHAQGWRKGRCHRHLLLLGLQGVQDPLLGAEEGEALAPMGRRVLHRVPIRMTVVTREGEAGVDVRELFQPLPLLSQEVEADAGSGIGILQRSMIIMLGGAFTIVFKL